MERKEGNSSDEMKDEVFLELENCSWRIIYIATTKCIKD